MSNDSTKLPIENNENKLTNPRLYDIITYWNHGKNLGIAQWKVNEITVKRKNVDTTKTADT